MSDGWDAPMMNSGGKVGKAIGKAAKRIGGLVHGKKVSNKWGRLGSPPHVKKVETIIKEIKSRHNRYRTEYRYHTKGGTKGSRYADVVEIDPKTGRVIAVYQVGRVNADGFPVSRERRALDDLLRFGRDDSGRGAPIIFYQPYYPSLTPRGCS